MLKAPVAAHGLRRKMSGQVKLRRLAKRSGLKLACPACPSSLLVVPAADGVVESVREA